LIWVGSIDLTIGRVSGCSENPFLKEIRRSHSEGKSLKKIATDPRPKAELSEAKARPQATPKKNLATNWK
jgi:hypothetical protein